MLPGAGLGVRAGLGGGAMTAATRWKVVKGDGRNDWVIEDADGYFVGSFDDKSNARLAVAAPDMRALMDEAAVKLTEAMGALHAIAKHAGPFDYCASSDGCATVRAFIAKLLSTGVSP